MSDTIFRNTVCDATINADITVPSTDGDALNLIKYLYDFNAHIALKKLDVERDGVDPTLYKYSFEAMDGRKWKQNIWVVPGQSAVQDFDVGNGTMAQGWDEDEFEHHRPVRATCISLIKNFGMYDLKVRW